MSTAQSIGGGGGRNAEVLILSEIEELENSIRHLERSNLELVEADPDDGDEEFCEARLENEDLVRRQRERVRKLKEQLRASSTSGAHVASGAPDAADPSRAGREDRGRAVSVAGANRAPREEEKSDEGVYL